MVGKGNGIVRVLFQHLFRRFTRFFFLTKLQKNIGLYVQQAVFVPFFFNGMIHVIQGSNSLVSLEGGQYLVDFRKDIPGTAKFDFFVTAAGAELILVDGHRLVG